MMKTRIAALAWLGMSLVAAEEVASPTKPESKEEPKEGDSKEKLDGRKRIILDNSVTLWLTKDSAEELEVIADRTKKIDEGKIQFFGNVTIRFKGANGQPIWLSAESAFISY